MPPEARASVRLALSDFKRSALRRRTITNCVLQAFRSSDGSLIINGHPDPRPERYCAALCDAYADGMRESGRIVHRIDVGRLTLPLPKQAQGSSMHEFDSAIERIGWAGHITVVYPLWLDRAPLPLQRLLLTANKRRRTPLGVSDADFAANKTIRAIVTMEMPAFAHRPANVPTEIQECLRLPISNPSAHAPIFIGCVNTISEDLRKRWLREIYSLGLAGR